MIIVAGDLMLDIFFTSTLRLEEQSAGIAARAGGSAANTSAWIAHLGEAVTFVGCTGDDSLGSALRTELAASGVTTKVRAIDGVETGCVAVEVTPEAQRFMKSSRGANEFLSPDDLRGLASPSVTNVHLTGYALVSPGGFEFLHVAAQLAEQCGALLSFDPASVGVIEKVKPVALLDALRLSRVGLLLLNSQEALALAGVPVLANAVQQLTDSVGMIVVKNGAKGALWARSDERSSVATSVHLVPTQPVRPLDTTGAGDAFNAGTIVGLARGDTLDGACQLGHQVASQTLGRLGGRPAPITPIVVAP